MAMAPHGLVQPARFASTARALHPTPSPPSCCSGCQLQQWKLSSGMSGKLCRISVGRQSHDGGILLPSCNGWQPEMESCRSSRRKRQSLTVTGALPTEVSAAATALAVGGALFALTKLNKDTETVRPVKTECEACGGSGVCPTCSGEGFVNKNLSTEAAAKARASAKDAATRYTAGLAKKWNYCTACGGGRGCQSCDGKGWIA